MATLDEQIQWEGLMVTRGKERYQKELAEAIKAQSETRILPQHHLMIDAVLPMAKAIDDLKASLQGAGRKHKALIFIRELASDEIALIVAKVIMAGISSKRSYLGLAGSLGSMMEEHVA